MVVDSVQSRRHRRRSIQGPGVDVTDRAELVLAEVGDEVDAAVLLDTDGEGERQVRVGVVRVHDRVERGQQVGG